MLELTQSTTVGGGNMFSSVLKCLPLATATSSIKSTPKTPLRAFFHVLKVGCLVDENLQNTLDPPNGRKHFISPRCNPFRAPPIVTVSCIYLLIHSSVPANSHTTCRGRMLYCQIWIFIQWVLNGLFFFNFFSFFYFFLLFLLFYFFFTFFLLFLNNFLNHIRTKILS